MKPNNTQQYLVKMLIGDKIHAVIIDAETLEDAEFMVSQTLAKVELVAEVIEQ